MIQHLENWANSFNHFFPKQKITNSIVVINILNPLRKEENSFQSFHSKNAITINDKYINCTASSLLSHSQSTESIKGSKKRSSFIFALQHNNIAKG